MPEPKLKQRKLKKHTVQPRPKLLQFPSGIDPFAKYTPQVSRSNPTMEDFWILMGWYRRDKLGAEFTRPDWTEDSNRVEAIRFLVEKVLKKHPSKITQKDFHSNKLRKMLEYYYSNSTYEALADAGDVYYAEDAREHAASGKFQFKKLYPWELANVPASFTFTEKSNRITAVQWLSWKTGKDFRDLTQSDFTDNSLGGMHKLYHSSSPHETLVDAGYAYSRAESLAHASSGNFRKKKFYPWEMSNSPLFYNLPEFRIAAAKWLVWKTVKEPREIVGPDFYSNRLSGLLTEHYNCSPYDAMLEAGLVTPKDESYMRSHGHTNQK
jgi:hypothetical protein